MRLGKHLATGHAVDDAEIIAATTRVDELLGERAEHRRLDLIARPSAVGSAKAIADAEPVPVAAGARLGS